MNESLYSVEHDKCMLPIKKLSNMKYELIRLSEITVLILIHTYYRYFNTSETKNLLPVQYKARK